MILRRSAPCFRRRIPLAAAFAVIGGICALKVAGYDPPYSDVWAGAAAVVLIVLARDHE